MDCDLSYTLEVDAVKGYSPEALKVEAFRELRLDLRPKIVEVTKFISDTVESKLLVVVSFCLAKDLFKL